MKRPPKSLFGPDEDSQLLGKAQSGCDRSREDLFSAAREYLRLLAKNSIDSNLRGRLSDSDVVQDSIVAAVGGFGEFQGKTPAQFAAWLRRIFVNRLINHYRDFRDTAKRDTSREHALEANPNLRQHLIANNETPSGQAVAREELEMMNGALSRISDDHRGVIEMRHRQHLSFAEIGVQLDRTPEAARMLWYRAFEALNREMDQIDPDRRNSAS